MAICLDTPAEGDSWNISLWIRGIDVWKIYEMDSETQAKVKHFDMVSEWKKWLRG